VGETAAAASAKMVAIMATYPHEVVRTRMREQAVHGTFKYKGFLNTLTIGGLFTVQTADAKIECARKFFTKITKTIGIR
jgi:hypothetical protein